MKVGSSLLADSQGHPDLVRIHEIAREVARLRAEGCRVVVVSSGAVAFGRQAMKWPGAPQTVAHSQMLASVGQALLIEAWRRALEAYGLVAGQVLLTHQVFAERPSYLNARITLRTMMDHGVIPVLNENDAVGHEEIRFGDNDELAALVASMTEADLLVLLTVPDGLHLRDPFRDPEAPRIREVDPEFRALEGVEVGEISAFGRGGMGSKINAARVTGAAGIPVMVCAGRVPEPLTRALSDPEAGTLFRPKAVPLELRRHWVRFGLKPLGRIAVDAGAAQALLHRGASVLPVGIREVAGEFQRGDAVDICGDDGSLLARGLAAYPADELRRIIGHNSGAIEEILGYRYLDVAVHRSDLILERE